MSKKGTKIEGAWVWQLREMLESSAWRALSLSARRVLDRVQIELSHHRGKNNGKLPVTYADFQAYGMDRDAIAPAIRECLALGFLEITEPGRAGNAEHRSPNQFRLTFRDNERGKPTDEWRRIKSDEEANSIARAARVAKKPPSRKSKTSRGISDCSPGETPTEIKNSHPGKPLLQPQSGEPRLLSKSTVGSASAPPTLLAAHPKPAPLVDMPIPAFPMECDAMTDEIEAFVVTVESDIREHPFISTCPEWRPTWNGTPPTDAAIVDYVETVLGMDGCRDVEPDLFAAIEGDRSE